MSTGKDTSKSAPAAGKPRRKRKCPICGAPSVDRFRPFCSKRCADIDLGRWFKEGYRIPAAEEPDPTDELDSEADSPDGSGS
jgi:endogenous inhibitor of DNA gyrase (YacG/DUF329 family)